MLGFNGTSPGSTLRVRAGDTLHILLKNTRELCESSPRSREFFYATYCKVRVVTAALQLQCCIAVPTSKAGLVGSRGGRGCCDALAHTCPKG